jgi:hypothetical protein
VFFQKIFCVSCSEEGKTPLTLGMPCLFKAIVLNGDEDEVLDDP